MPSRWRALIELDENNGPRGIVTTVYVRGDCPSEEEARRAGEQAARAWLAGGLLPKSDAVSACEQLRAAVAAFTASGPARVLVRMRRQLIDAVDRHRASGCKDTLHAAEGDRAIAGWREAEATLAQQSRA
jgi:hypothetical protein